MKKIIRRTFEKKIKMLNKSNYDYLEQVKRDNMTLIKLSITESILGIYE